MCSPQNTGKLDFSLRITGGLSQGYPDFQKVYVFKVYVHFSCPRIVLQIFPDFFEDFSCFVSQQTETTKNSPKSQPFFNAKSPGKHASNIHKIFWRGGKVDFPTKMSRREVRFSPFGPLVEAAGFH